MAARVRAMQEAFWILFWGVFERAPRQELRKLLLKQRLRAYSMLCSDLLPVRQQLRHQRRHVEVVPARPRVPNLALQDEEEEEASIASLRLSRLHRTVRTVQPQPHTAPQERSQA
mmetsp:Transcript_12016/g.30818  ORF Transcript_12016/g.30818 Transcript_12016/m.30818 type:complete len:115 (+) Transcript_12016:509-853(+)